MSVELDKVSAKYGDFVVFKNLSFEVPKQKFVTLLGPSGCGKSTILNVVTGLLEPYEGSVLLDGNDITRVPPYLRGMSMIFQSYALFPHMNVFDNVRFGLKIRKVSREESEKKVREVLELVKLDGYEKRMPSQLSGGEQQRVALARGLAIDPKVLLLDEPLSNLDAKLRIHMRTEIKKIQKRVGVTTIYVTHDQIEALTMADQVVVMDKGKILQIGDPRNIYEKPSNRFVADFIGETNLIHGKIKEVTERSVLVSGPGFAVPLTKDKLVSEPKEGKGVLICIRPEHLRLLEGRESPTGVFVGGRVSDVQYLGASVKYLLELTDGQVMEVRGPSENEAVHLVNEQVRVQITPSLVNVLEGEN